MGSFHPNFIYLIFLLLFAVKELLFRWPRVGPVDGGGIDSCLELGFKIVSFDCGYLLTVDIYLAEK